MYVSMAAVLTGNNISCSKYFWPRTLLQEKHNILQNWTVKNFFCYMCIQVKPKLNIFLGYTFVRSTYTKVSLLSGPHIQRSHFCQVNIYKGLTFVRLMLNCSLTLVRSHLRMIALTPGIRTWDPILERNPFLVISVPSNLIEVPLWRFT